VLLLLLVKTFATRGPIIVGIDDTIERRWGAKIKARGIYRDPVRSSHSHTVKASGLRWLSVMLLVPIPLGQTRVGIAVLDRVGALGTLLSGKATRAQETHRVGATSLLQVHRLVADARPGNCGGQQFRGDYAVGPLAPLA